MKLKSVGKKINIIINVNRMIFTYVTYKIFSKINEDVFYAISIESIGVLIIKDIL